MSCIPTDYNIHLGDLLLEPLELDNWDHQWESLVGKQLNKYTADLLALANCRPQKSIHLPDHLSRVTTLPKLQAWEKALVRHPDRDSLWIICCMESGRAFAWGLTTRSMSANQQHRI